MAKTIKYRLTMTYLNGDVETINAENVDDTSFEEMRKFYHHIKDKYQDNKMIATINFDACNKNGVWGNRWTKEVNINSHNLDLEKKEFIKNNIDTDSREITKEIMFRFNCLIEMKEYHSNQLSACDIERSMLLHEIEIAKNKVFKSQEEEQDYKNNFYTRLQENEIIRRKHKQQVADLTSMFGRLKIEDILTNIESWWAERKPFIKTIEEFKQENKQVEYYKDNNERLKYISKYEKLKYDEVYWYENDKKLVFVKKLGMGKKKNRNKPIQIKRMDLK